jgi:hypothetical protein
MERFPRKQEPLQVLFRDAEVKCCGFRKGSRKQVREHEEDIVFRVLGFRER